MQADLELQSLYKAYIQAGWEFSIVGFALQEGQTAAELAREAGYDFIAQYIENHVAESNGRTDSGATWSA